MDFLRETTYDKAKRKIEHLIPNGMITEIKLSKLDRNADAKEIEEYAEKIKPELFQKLNANLCLRVIQEETAVLKIYHKTEKVRVYLKVCYTKDEGTKKNTKYTMVLPLEVNPFSGKITYADAKHCWSLQSEVLRDENSKPQIFNPLDSSVKLLCEKLKENCNDKIGVLFNVLSRLPEMNAKGLVFFKKLSILTEFLTEGEYQIATKELINTKFFQNQIHILELFSQENPTQAQKAAENFYLIHTISRVMENLVKKRIEYENQNNQKMAELTNKIIKLVFTPVSKSKARLLNEFTEYRDSYRSIGCRAPVELAAMSCYIYLDALILLFLSRKDKTVCKNFLSELNKVYQRLSLRLDVYDLNSWSGSLKPYLTNAEYFEISRLTKPIYEGLTNQQMERQLSVLLTYCPTAFTLPKRKQISVKDNKTQESILEDIFKDCGVNIEYRFHENNSSWVILNNPIPLSKIRKFAQHVLKHKGNITQMAGDPETEGGFNLEQLLPSDCWTFKLNERDRVSIVQKGKSIVILQIGEHATTLTKSKADNYYEPYPKEN